MTSNDNRIKPCMVLLEPITPKAQLTLSAELRNVILERNMLTTRTTKKYVSALNQLNGETAEEERKGKRDRIIQEILTSELSYLNQLEVIERYFKQPIGEQNLLSEKDFQTLFGNINGIYNVNRELLNEIKADTESIAAAFLRMAPFFKLYSVHAYNYKRCIEILQKAQKDNPGFLKYLELQESRPEVKAKLSSLLISPVQRVPRYCMLLKQLLRYTPKSHPDYSALIGALQNFEAAANHINKLVEEQENMQRLLELQRNFINNEPVLLKPGRRVLKEGFLMKMCVDGKKSIKRYCIVLNDVFLCAKLKRDNLNVANSLKVCHILPLNRCTVKEVFSKGIFEIAVDGSQFTFYDQNAAGGGQWIAIIQKAIRDYQNENNLYDRLNPEQPLRNNSNHTDDDAGCFAVSKRKSFRNLGEIALSNKIRKTDSAKDSLFPMRHCNTNTKADLNLQDDNVYVFGNDDNINKGFNFHMRNFFSNVTGSFKKFLGFK